MQRTFCDSVFQAINSVFEVSTRIRRLHKGLISNRVAADWNICARLVLYIHVHMTLAAQFGSGRASNALSREKLLGRQKNRFSAPTLRMYPHTSARFALFQYQSCPKNEKVLIPKVKSENRTFPKTGQEWPFWPFFEIFNLFHFFNIFLSFY